MSNNESMGGAKPHEGKERVASIVRSAGDATADEIVENGSRSPHACNKDGGAPNYAYKKPGTGWGGNVNR